MINAKTPIIIFKRFPSSWTANMAPNKAPSVIPKATCLNRVKSIACFFLWALADESPVKNIQAREDFISIREPDYHAFLLLAGFSILFLLVTIYLIK